MQTLLMNDASSSLTVTPRHDERASLERSFKRLDALARLMDDQFELPLVRVRVGLDALIGLIPGGGDWAVWAVSVYIFWEAARLGAPIPLLLRMALNIAVDLLGGYAPVVGDVFDVFYRANKRNVELLHAHYGARPELGAPLPAVLPERALSRHQRPAALRYGFALFASILLLALASGPFLLLYLLLHGA